MPRTVITERTMPIILQELDKWTGKLTWDLFADHVAKVLGERKISRHTLISYPQITTAFADRKAALRSCTDDTRAVKNYTLDHLLKENEVLQAENERLKK